jgi:serine/threonine-protein kinase
MEMTCPQCDHRNPKDAKFCKECGFQLARTTDPLIGQKIGNHRLVKRIGVGGMGVVYLAEHVNLGKKYAVKFLHPQFASDEEVVERFRREAQVLAALDHENIIRENDFGWLDGVGFYLIMEYLEGETLKDLIREEGPLEIDRIIALFEQLMNALDEAHTEGVIHRDLKPENIFLIKKRGREQLKILDFGIARVLLDGAQKDFTVDGEVYGSPTYMSPEQARGEISKVDHRADLYAVGIILVEVLTGRPPYRGSTPSEVMLAHISGLPPRLSDLNPDIRFAAALEDIVLKALAKEADERFQSAHEFWDILLPVLEKTKALQNEDMEQTVDGVIAAPVIPQTTGRVLVSREWTPSRQVPPIDALPAIASEPSLPGAAARLPVPAVEGAEQASPTSEMQGLPEPAGRVHVTQEQIPVVSRTDAPQGFLSDTPQPIRDSSPPVPLAPSTPEVPFNQPRPLLPPTPSMSSSMDNLLSAMTSFDEDDDDDPTTVSSLSDAGLISTPHKSMPPSAQMPLPHSQGMGDFPIDVLDSRDKTTAEARQNVPAQSIPQRVPTPVSSPQPVMSPVSHGSSGFPTGTRPASLFDTQSQELPGEDQAPGLGSKIMKHPALLGGVVGFVLLFLLWMLLPSKPDPASQQDADAGSGVLVGKAPSIKRETRRIPALPPQNRRRLPTPNRPVVPRKTEVRTRPVPVPAELMRLTIKTTPSKANVIIQGRGKVGTTPYTLKAAKGSYLRIYIQKDGYQSRMVSWRASEHNVETIRLLPE